MMNYKLIATACFLFLIFLTPSLAVIGIGLTNYRLDITAKIGESREVALGVFNPGEEELRVRMWFECMNCKEEVKIFGRKIAEKELDINQIIKLEKEYETLPPYTSPEASTLAKFYITPKLLVRKNLRIFTPEFLNFFIRLIKKDYDGSFRIPYFTLLIGEQKIYGQFNVQSLRAGVATAVAASIHLTLIGMPLGSFIFLLLAFILLIILVVRRIRKPKK